MFPDYNPFSKAFSELLPDDLAVLRRVAEGWFVEYKREPQEPWKIARSVAALANTRGGWLFIGVVCPSSSDGTPTAFPGIPVEDVPASLSRIRDSVASHLNPHPFFEVRSFAGPVEALALPEGRSLLGVAVTRGDRTPYVHSSGTVFVRVADRSEPIAETDRNRIGELFRRGENREELLRRRLDQIPHGSEDSPSLQMAILVDPYDEKRFRHSMTLTEFARIVDPSPHDAPPRLYWLPMPYVQSMADGFAARQERRGASTELLWRFTSRCESLVSIGLPAFDVSGAMELRSRFRNYEQVVPFADAWNISGTDEGRVVDLGLLAGVLIGVFGLARQLLAKCQLEHLPDRVRVRLQLRNVGGSVPFVDTEAYSAYVGKFGLPFSLEEHVLLPSGDATSFYELPIDEEHSEGVAGVLVALMVTRSLGIPWIESAVGKADKELPEDAKTLIADWLAVVSRTRRARRQ